jgi:hypothetical protein
MKKLVLAVVVLALVISTDIANAQQNREVVLVNNSSSKICRFHASNTNRDKWEEDILGDRVLRPGQKMRINIDDGTGSCWFDFKTVLCDGTSIVRESINVCKTGRYTIND